MFALRVSPPDAVREAARSFDEVISNTFVERFALDLSEKQWLQVALPVRFGGLGIMKAVDLVEACFLGSLVTSQPAVAAILGRRVSLRCFQGASEAFEALRGKAEFVVRFSRIFGDSGVQSRPGKPWKTASRSAFSY